MQQGGRRQHQSSSQIASKPACVHSREQSPGFSGPSICPSGPLSRQRCSPGWGPAPVDLASFTHSSQGCQSHPDAYFFCPMQLHRDLLCSSGCERDLLPVSSWFLVRIFPRRCIFDLFVGGCEFHVLLLRHLDPPPHSCYFWEIERLYPFYKKDSLLQTVFAHSKKYTEQLFIF